MAAADTIKDIMIEVKRCADCGARFAIDAAFCPFDGVPLSTSTWDKADDPRAHVEVDGRYEVLEPLGEGGMGTVYKVRHVALDRLFAMKVLRRDLAADPDLAKRFVQEARATAAIRHPCVVAITDFGDMEDGVPYFVMELLEGETLATRIRARGLVPPRAALAIGKQIADGLSASHAANVIHRDLKPDNVFLVGRRAAEEEIRIVDFGAAKIVGGSKLTRPGIVFGTPYYMSPEQASGQPIDGRADVYSLGILLYEMVTGRVPFEAETYMGVLTKHLFQAPPRMVVPSGAPLGDLEAIVMRALQKDPADRYESMAAFARVLEEAASGTAVGAARVEPASRTTVKLGTMPRADRIEPSVTRRGGAETRRKRRIAIAAVSAGVALVAGGALFALATLRSTHGAAATVEPATSAVTPPSAASAASAASAVSAVSAVSAAAIASGPGLNEPGEDGAPAVAPGPTATSDALAGAAGSASATSRRSAGPPSPSPSPSPELTSTPRSPPPVSTPAAAPRTDDFLDPWKR